MIRSNSDFDGWRLALLGAGMRLLIIGCTGRFRRSRRRQTGRSRASSNPDMRYAPNPRRLLYFVTALLLVGAGGTAIDAQNARQNAADADRLIKAMDVKPGSVIAEIGAGGGELTVALAKAVGPAGKIYSNELNKDRLIAIRKAADEAGLNNVTTVEGKEDVANLPDACCDGIFMRNVYHHFG